MLIIVILGCSGVGKGCLCEFLIKNIQDYNIGTCSIGEKLREQNQCLLSGDLSPQHIINKILSNFLQSHYDVYLLDGYPRSIEQASFFKENDNLIVINLFLNNIEIIYNRLKNRYFCLNCKMILNQKICKHCYASGIRRVDDDSIAIIEKRMQIYIESIDSILDYFHSMNVRILQYDMSGDMSLIHEQILKDILTFLKKTS